MCFGGDKDNAPAPRPAQPQSPPAEETKRSSVPTAFDQQQQQQQQLYAPPPGPPPSSQQDHHQQQYAPPPGPPPARQENPVYAPPSGPPPSHSPAPARDDYAPPPGPPPAAAARDEYAPPTGPPPSSQQQSHGDYAPPPGPPPPSSSQHDYTAPPPGPPPAQAKPAHDWETAVSDTTLFPPPPAFFSGWDRSPANNSTEQEAEAGEAWVNQYPLVQPLRLDPAALHALRTHDIRLMQPTGFRGRLAQLGPGFWECRTDRHAPDSCIIGYPPMYAVTDASPLATGRPAVVYYEVHLRADSRAEETSLALGYTALPYPNFRLPGWHRGSLAVHGDDGHRYINDRWGGKSFTGPFRRGETVGIGMRFEPVDGRINVDIFFTRNGKLDGSWNLHEESDAEQDLPVTGLEGFHDLSCAIGTFKMVSFEVVFEPSRWKYKDL